MGDAAFESRYGPWALICGASDGVGEALAWDVAARGVNVVLLARRETMLEHLAASIRTSAGVEARPLAVDLAREDAATRIIAETDDLEIGLVAYCAGADSKYEPFLAQPVDHALAMVQRNCNVPVQLCHHFGGQMAARGRGGIVIVGSGAGLVGAPNMVAYGATKAFDMVFAEALWAELHERGVDVLGVILALTDTPALRRLLVRRGLLTNEHDDTPIPGAVSSQQVAEETIANLANGPTYFVGEMLRDGAQQLAALPRNDAVRLMIELGGDTMGRTEEVAG